MQAFIFYNYLLEFALWREDLLLQLLWYEISNNSRIACLGSFFEVSWIAVLEFTGRNTVLFLPVEEKKRYVACCIITLQSTVAAGNL